MIVFFRDKFWDGRERFARGEAVLPDDYPVERLPSKTRMISAPKEVLAKLKKIGSKVNVEGVEIPTVEVSEPELDLESEPEPEPAPEPPKKASVTLAKKG